LGAEPVSKRFGVKMEVGSLELPVVAPLLFTVAPPARPLLFEALLFRRLHVRHVLPILLQHTTPVHLTPEAFKGTINVFVIADFDTNRQGRSLRKELGSRRLCVSAIGQFSETQVEEACFFFVSCAFASILPFMVGSPLLLATGNHGKVQELRALLADLPVRLLPASALDAPPTVTEDADTLDGNAQKKARAFHKHTGHPALADDTGLEVVALDGGPGVHTARFAGPDATPDDNKQKLMAVMEGIDDRRARFRTVAALVEGDGTVHTFEGICEGIITTEARGDGGFGYDPLFRPDEHDQTFAEMPPEEKNKISHRRKALDALRRFLVDAN